MQPLEQFRLDAMTLAPASFARRHANWFLVHVPYERARWDEAMKWPSETPAGTLEHRGVPAPQWAIPIAKRRGTPNPERFSVGSATSRDLVLDYDFVSKLHAQIVLDADARTIQDLGSAGGTSVNGSAVHGMARARLEAGDRVSFGKLWVQLYEAASFHARLRAARPLRVVQARRQA